MAEERLGANFSIDISELQAGLKTANRLIRESQSEFKAAAAGMDDWTKSEDGLRAKINSLNSIIATQKEKVGALQKNYDALIDGGLDPASDRAIYLRTQINNETASLEKNKAELAKNEKALDELGNETDEAADKSEKAAKGGFTVLKAALANLAADAIRKCIDGLTSLAKTVVSTGIEFESSMSQVASVSGATGDEILALTEKAKEMGAKTKFSASESADAFNYMAMAGWKTEEMISGIDGIMNLAAASGSDLATASDIVTDALTAMGYKAKDAGRLADVMAAASSNANTNVEMMGATFQYAAPIVGALGYSMEDTAVAIGLMANAGIKADKAGTALRSVLTRLSAPPKECAQEMEKLGISITDSNGKMKSLDTVMNDLRKAFNGLSETEQTAAAKHLAGQEAMSGLLAIVNAAPEDFNKLTKAVENSEGAAEKMANTMLDNLGGDITLLKSAWEGFTLQLYEGANGPMRQVVQEVTNGIIPALSDLINGVEGAGDRFGESVGKILTTVVNTITAAAPSIMKALVMIIKSLLSAIIEAAPTLINTVLSVIPELLTEVLSMLPTILNTVITIIIAIMNSLSDMIPSVVSAVMEIIPVLITSLVEATPELLQAAVTLFMAIIQAIPFIINELIAVLPTIIDTIINTLLDNLPMIIDAAITLFMGIIQAIPQIIAALNKNIPTIIRSIYKGLLEGIPDLINAGLQLLAGLFEGLLDPQVIWNSVKQMGTSILDGIKSFFGIKSPSKLMEKVIGKNLALGIGEGFENNIGKVNDQINKAIKLEDAKIDVVKTLSGEAGGKSVVVNQYNTYSQAHSRYELYKSKQQTAAAVRLALGTV